MKKSGRNNMREDARVFEIWRYIIAHPPLESIKLYSKSVHTKRLMKQFDYLIQNLL